MKSKQNPIDPLLKSASRIRLDSQSMQALTLLLPTLGKEQRKGLEELLKTYEEAEQESTASVKDALAGLQKEYVTKLAALRREHLIKMVSAKSTTHV